MYKEFAIERECERAIEARQQTHFNILYLNFYVEYALCVYGAAIFCWFAVKKYNLYQYQRNFSHLYACSLTQTQWNGLTFRLLCVYVRVSE